MVNATSVSFHRLLGVEHSLADNLLASFQVYMMESSLVKSFTEDWWTEWKRKEKHNRIVLSKNYWQGAADCPELILKQRKVLFAARGFFVGKTNPHFETTALNVKATIK